MKKFLFLVVFFLFTTSVFAMDYSSYNLDTRFSQNLSEYKDTLVSWDFSAEYIPNNYDITKADSIKVYIRDNVYTIPWVFTTDDAFGLIEKTVNINTGSTSTTITNTGELDIGSLFNLVSQSNSWNTVDENDRLENSWITSIFNISNQALSPYKLFWNSKDYLYQKDEEWIKCFYNEFLKDSKTQKSYAWSKCLDVFDGFVWFSPNWDYLLYKVSNWFKIYKTIMVNVKTWVKTVVMDSPRFYGFVWTKENKQFVYGWGSDVVWRQGLYISEKWNYGQTIRILSDYIDSGYIEWDYIYVNTHNYNWVYNTFGYLMFTNLKHYYKVLSIKTWDLVYSQEIK